MRFFFLFTMLCFCLNYPLFSQELNPLSEQSNDVNDSQSPLEDTSEPLDDETGNQQSVLSNTYFDFDFGVPITFFPQRSLWNAYRDADGHYNSLRAATSFTIDRFRIEFGYLKSRYNEGQPDINYYDGKQINNSRSKMTLDQQEVLLFWLRNDPHRISFIGGGIVYLTVNEEFSMDYTSGGQTKTIKRKETDKARGYKFVVGGKDIDSYLKTTFSYTSAFIENKSGKRFDLGEFAFTFSISFSGI